MVHYEFSENVQEAIARFASRHSESDFVYRHLIEDRDGLNRNDSPEAIFKQLTDRFVERFGCEPRDMENPR